jgi:hypothetical protein
MNWKVLFVCTMILGTAVSGFAQKGKKRVSKEEYLKKVYAERKKTPTVRDSFLAKESYYPFTELGDAVITIPVSFVVITDTANDQGLSHGNETKESFRIVLQMMNKFYEKNTPPIDDIPGRKFVEDIKIRLRLNDIYIFDDPELCENKRLNQLYEGVYKRHPEARNSLVIVSNRFMYSGAWGWSSTVRVQDEEVPGFIIQTLNVDDMYFQGKESQYARHWVHEINHLFGLGHIYSGSVGTESCDPSHPDFLSDVFGTEPQKWCDEARTNCVACYYTKPNNLKTNNIMNGNGYKQEEAAASYFSPMQIARIHRQLMISPLRHIAEGYQADNPYRIHRSDTLKKDMRFYQDIYIPEGVTWVVQSKVIMSSECVIYVEPGGMLLIDGGEIGPADFKRYATWKGVRMLSKGMERGMIRLLNGGQLNTSTPEMDDLLRRKR